VAVCRSCDRTARGLTARAPPFPVHRANRTACCSSSAAKALMAEAPSGRITNSLPTWGGRSSRSVGVSDALGRRRRRGESWPDGGLPVSVDVNVVEDGALLEAFPQGERSVPIEAQGVDLAVLETILACDLMEVSRAIGLVFLAGARSGNTAGSADDRAASCEEESGQTHLP
jgi:hypothetical protein